MKREPIRLSEDEARPCPFCGRQPTVRPWCAETMVYVTCPEKGSGDCPVPSVADETREKALRRWNTRK